jgi:hypothetical protein
MVPVTTNQIRNNSKSSLNPQDFPRHPYSVRSALLEVMPSRMTLISAIMACLFGDFGMDFW